MYRRGELKFPGKIGVKADEIDEISHEEEYPFAFAGLG